LEELPTGVHQQSLDMLAGFSHSADAAQRDASALEFCTIQAHCHQELYKAQPTFSNIQTFMKGKLYYLNLFIMPTKPARKMCQ